MKNVCKIILDRNLASNSEFCRTWNEVLCLLNFFETRSTMIKNYSPPRPLESLTDTAIEKLLTSKIFHQTLRLRCNTNSLISAMANVLTLVPKLSNLMLVSRSNLNGKKRKPTNTRHSEKSFWLCCFCRQKIESLKAFACQLNQKETRTRSLWWEQRESYSRVIWSAGRGWKSSAD